MKRIMFVFLMALLLGGSAFAFAWWDNLEDSQNVSIGTGEGVTLEVALGTDEGADKLVPAGVVPQPGQTESYVLTYDVTLDNEITGDLTLDVVASDILVNGSTDLSSYIDVDIADDNEGTIGNETVVVTVTVTLTIDSGDPEADIEALKNADITFDLTFTAAQD